MHWSDVGLQTIATSQTRAEISILPMAKQRAVIRSFVLNGKIETEAYKHLVGAF